MTDNRGKLGLWALVALVFGMMVGSGLFNIPQNLALGAGPGAVAAGWIITAVGMLLLVATFKILADRRPDLNAGIYQYAKEGFGNYTGFNIAWGYWLCTAFANVAYAVMLNDSFGAFFPALLRHGVPTLIFGTILIWTMFFLVAGGIRTARIINNLLALVKVGTIILIIILLWLNIKADTFRINWISEFSDTSGWFAQVKSTMLVTLWCFIGIEGAVMMSARARRSADVGRAGVIGFLSAWVLYVLVSMLCFGVMSRARLAGMADPSVAYILREICGAWAYTFVIISVIVSLLGGWLAWTLVCAQVPYEAAIVHIFPRTFLRLNRHGMPAFGLLVSSIVMQVFLVMVLMADDVYMTALVITGMMILPAYLSGGAYLWKISLRPAEIRRTDRKALIRFRITGIAATFYCLWLIYAGGWELFLFTSFFYFAGSGFYIRARRERSASGKLRLTRADILTTCVLFGALLGAVTLLATGHSPL